MDNDPAHSFGKYFYIKKGEGQRTVPLEFTLFLCTVLALVLLRVEGTSILGKNQPQWMWDHLKVAPSPSLR